MYLVNDRHRFVYCIIQKVACSSIKTALAPLFELDGDPLVRKDSTTSIHRILRNSDDQIERSEFLGRDYSDYFKFAFVRDPYDRLLSCYLQKCTPGTRGKPFPPQYEDVTLYKGMPFSEFVEAVHKIPDEAADPHYRSQHLCLKAEDGSLIPDYIGYFENLEQDFSYVAHRLGHEMKLPHLTRSPPKEGHYYDDHLRLLVAERFARDFEALGYRI